MTFDQLTATLDALVGQRVSVAVGLADMRVTGIAGRLRAPADDPPIQFTDGAPIVYPIIPRRVSLTDGEYGVLVLHPAKFVDAAWTDTPHGRALRIDQAGVVITLVPIGATDA